MNARRLGYRPSPPGLGAQRDARPHLGAGPVPAASDLVSLTTVLDQDYEDCVYNSIANVVRGCQLAEGAPAETPILSRLAAYWLGRSYLRETDQDAGSFIHLGFEAISTFGFCPEELWPYSGEDRWKKQPPLSVLEGAFDQRQPTDYRRILSIGGALVDDVKRALGAGHLVVYGVQVTDQFCSGNLGPTGIAQPPEPGDQIAGGHAMVLCGHDGDRAARSLTSWGTNVFQGGYFDISWDYVQAATDLWIAVSTPRFKGF